MIQDSIVSIALGCRLDDLGYESQQIRRFALLQNVQIGSGSHLTSCSMGTGGCVPGSRVARA